MQTFRAGFFQKQSSIKRPGYDFAFAVRQSHDTLPRQKLEGWSAPPSAPPKASPSWRKRPSPGDAQASADQEHRELRQGPAPACSTRSHTGAALIAED